MRFLRRKKGKIVRYHKRLDRIIALLGDVLIRRKLSEYLNITRKDIHLDYNKYGKPYLMNRENVYFNISHSHEYVTLCYSSTDIGIDIEFEICRYTFNH